MESIVTIGIILITCIVSFLAFNNQRIIDALIFYPPAVDQDKEWYRFFSCGLIHADIGHLLFNMLALYFFGKDVEQIFKALLGSMGPIVYLLLYVSALALSILPTYHKHKRSYYYRSLGASGAVSAIVFAGLALIPTGEVYMYFIPIPIPGFIFAPLYLLISFALQKRGRDNINHSAHIWGSIYGAAFVIV
ncbi:MAG TPA: rhomboid family intramembrane serine protease, partial [Flavisolibacter sp.]|nr:rhomboid family intramembrane serine protease [Flavisolibacter sp.]